MKFDFGDIYDAENDLLDDEVDEFEDAEKSLLNDLSSDIDSVGNISDEDVENFDYDPENDDEYNDFDDSDYIEYHDDGENDDESNSEDDITYEIDNEDEEDYINDDIINYI